MQKGIFSLSVRNIFSAVSYAVISAVLLYVTNLTDLSSFNLHTVGFIALTTGTASLLKNFFTTDQGNLGGVLPVANPAVPESPTPLNSTTVA